MIGLSKYSTNLFRPFISWETYGRYSYITHYSYFGSFRSDVSNVGPNAAMLTQQGKLTDIGSWYLGGVKTGNKPQGAASQKAVFAGAGVLIGLVSLWSIV